MNKVDIIRKHIGDDDFYDMNGTSMLTNILNAMEEYKEQEVKNCSIPDVSQQREQLIDFAIRFDGGNTRTNRKAYEQEVDDYLKSINCG